MTVKHVLIINHLVDDYHPQAGWLSRYRFWAGLRLVLSRSTQGLTAECGLIHADTGVDPDLLNSRSGFGYVSVSRAGQEASLVADALARLIPPIRRG